VGSDFLRGSRYLPIDNDRRRAAVAGANHADEVTELPVVEHEQIGKLGEGALDRFPAPLVDGGAGTRGAALMCKRYP